MVYNLFPISSTTNHHFIYNVSHLVKGFEDLHLLNQMPLAKSCMWKVKNEGIIFCQALQVLKI